MKRFFVCFFCLVMLATCTGRAEEALNIRQLREQAPKRWTQTYETQWRDIAIDAEVTVPEVDVMPVVLMGGGATAPVLTAEEAGWDEIDYYGLYDLRLINHVPDYPKKVDGVRVATPVAEGNWYSGFEPENQYVPLDDVTFGEIVSRVKEKIAQLGYEPNDYSLDNPVRLWTHHVYGYGTQKDVLAGYLYMEVRPKLAGISVLSHILQAVSGGSNRDDEWLLMPNTSIGYNGYLGDLSHIYLKPLEIRETLAEDVPLCSFDRVMDTVEAEIEDGHIRRIYEIELGYVLYNEPDAYRTSVSTNGKRVKGETNQAYQSTRYYAKPMWQINCLYVESPKGKLRDVSGYTDDERNSLDYRQLIIDAQTGVLVQPTDAQDRCAFKGFISWEEIR